MITNLSDCEKSIDELKDSGTIINFYSETIKQTTPRNKIIDYKLRIQAHPEFISEVKKGNYIKLLQDKAESTRYGGNSDSVT